MSLATAYLDSLEVRSNTALAAGFTGPLLVINPCSLTELVFILRRIFAVNGPQFL